MRTLLQEGFGLSWVLPEGAELIKKTLAPSCIFIDSDQFAQTNVKHRLAKRGIAAYVSVAAPLTVLASEDGFAGALDKTHADPALLTGRVLERVELAVQRACEQGADAIVVCDELFRPGAVVDPFYVTESLMPVYRRLAAKAHDGGVGCLFHTEGDARDYYPALADAGFDGVHVSHPVPACVAELFSAARAAGLAPVGGIVGAGILDRPVEDDVAFVGGLLEGGPALITDDGELDGVEQLARAIEVIKAVRGRDA